MQVMSTGVGYFGNERRLHVGRSKSWDGMGRFMNQKEMAEPQRSRVDNVGQISDEEARLQNCG